jgi:AmmeMemoRadiSam system protein A
MAPSPCIDLRPGHREQLLDIARDSISTGLQAGEALRLDIDAVDGDLRQALGVFVTLTRDSALRGCIGSMQSPEPLAQGVANAAFSAAFRDPRFPCLRTGELAHIRIEVSVLSTLEPVPADSRDDLLDLLQPGRDGLLLEDGRYRATFLPKVWEQLPEPELFLQQLLAKAGLAADHWSESLRCYRYQTLSFAEI